MKIMGFWCIFFPLKPINWMKPSQEREIFGSWSADERILKVTHVTQLRGITLNHVAAPVIRWSPASRPVTHWINRELTSFYSEMGTPSLLDSTGRSRNGWQLGAGPHDLGNLSIPIILHKMFMLLCISQQPFPGETEKAHMIILSPSFLK